MPNLTRTLVLALLLIAPLAEGSSILHGETVLRSVSPEKIAVLIDTDGDELIDRGFLLAVDIPVGTLAERFPAAAVQFNQGFVRVISENRVFDLQVAGYPDPPPAAKGSRVVTLIGYSLIDSSGDSGCDVRSAFEQERVACFAYDRH